MLGYMQITCGEPYSPYSPFGRSTRKFKFNKPFLGTDRVKLIWKENKIKELRQCLGYVRAHLIKKTFEASPLDTSYRHDLTPVPRAWVILG